MRARRMPAGERKQQILDAAEEVFSSAGYRDVSTAAVAAAAGVSEPTLYRYFESKRDLYLAMLKRNAERLVVSWRQTAAASPDPMSALIQIGIDYSTQLAADPSPFLLRARSLLETSDPAIAAHAREKFWETFEFVQKIYDDAIEAGQLPADSDSRSLAWLFMAVGGLLDQFLLMGMEPPDQNELAKMMSIVWPRVQDARAVALPKKRRAR